MKAYYNEFDPFAAAWLRNLIAEGLIAPGDVDERDIRDIKPSELAGYTQCHFFAGIGGWSYALRLAGWPDDRPVWTGSCPCQPFSAAGKGGGFADERHLWPAFFHLTRERRPNVIFGEQVASAAGLDWFDVVQTDLEATGYAAGAVDIGAAGVGAPHIRQRLFWVADALSAGRAERRPGSGDRSIARGGAPGKLAHVDGGNAGAEGLQRSGQHGQQQEDGRACVLGDTDRAPGQRRAGGIPGAQAPIDRENRSQHGREPHGPEHAGEGIRELANPHHQGQGRGRVQGYVEGGGPRDGATCERSEGLRSSGELAHTGSARLPLGPQPDDGRRALRQQGETPAESGTLGRPGPTNGHWRDADWLGCTDGKWRPVEPGTFPLAHGIPNRVGSLRGYGNAIVPQVAAEFIGAYVEAREHA